MLESGFAQAKRSQSMECDSELDPASLSTSNTEPLQKEVGVQTIYLYKQMCVW